ncbi:MAG: oligosaccharide flippase family protein [Microthrixaceae bacterium]|nr:oligosaccharide flippase family protein [Microthrixaceae bacterium]
MFEARRVEMALSGKAGLWLGIGRAAEQAAYGSAMLVLAARMTVREFGSIATLFVINSVVLTLSDLGVAHDIVRTPNNVLYPVRGVHIQRVVNAILAFISIAVGLLISGDAGLLILIGGMLWAVGGEAYVRQAAALRLGKIRRLVAIDFGLAAVFILLIVFLASPTHALTVVGMSLILHHLLVVVLLPIGSAAIGPTSLDSRPFGFLLNHSLGYITRNIDYILAGPLLGPSAFSSYVLGFRVANAPTAPLGSIVLRWGLTRFAAESAEERELTHRRAAVLLIAAGCLGMCLTLLLAIALPWAIGDRWRMAASVSIILALALPWRMIDGLIGAVGFSSNSDVLLNRFEIFRIALTLAGLLVGGQFGLGGFVGAATSLNILLIAFGHLLVSRSAGLTPSRVVLLSAPLLTGLALLLSAVVF